MALVTFSHTFTRGLAAGRGDTRAGAVYDPAFVDIALTPSDDVSAVLAYGRSDEHPEMVRKVSIGVWAFDLDDAIWTPGQHYTLHIRYVAGPHEQPRVVRQSFGWMIPTPLPRPGYCVVHGRIINPFGVPEFNRPVTLALYSDVTGIASQTSAVQTATDPFGRWSAELPIGSLLRRVTDRGARFVTVPDAAEADEAALIPYQPTEAAHDAFGAQARDNAVANQAVRLLHIPRPDGSILDLGAVTAEIIGETGGSGGSGDSFPVSLPTSVYYGIVVFDPRPGEQPLDVLNEAAKSLAVRVTDLENTPSGNVVSAVLRAHFGDSTPVQLFVLPAGLTVISARLDVEIAFNGTGASISVGTFGDPDAVLSAAASDLTTLDTYGVDPAFAGPAVLFVFITPGVSATTGQALITLLARS